MPCKLLLADDSVTIQRVIELTFAEEDIEVITVGDGQRAVERIESDRPDIVLADVGMPERDGYEVAAYVKGHPQLSQVPVVLLTGAFERIDEQRARAVGCDGVLSKPFEPQAVITQVRELLARGRSSTGRFAVEPIESSIPTPVRAMPQLRAVEPVHEPRAADAMMSAAGQDPLDEYFDRLDAAFANLGSGAPTAPLSRVPSTEAPTHVGWATEDSKPHSGSPSAGQRVERPVVAPPATTPWTDTRPVGAPPVGEPRPTVTPISAAAPTEQLRSVVTHEPQPAPPSPPPVRAWPAEPASSHAAVMPAAPVTPARAATAGPPPLADAFAALLAAEQGRPAPSPAGAPAVSAAQETLSSEELVERVTMRVLERMSERIVRETVSDVVLRVADRLVREEIERIKAAVR